ncbi:MAG: lysine--tRNA ligase, partial [Flavobacteriales bacterium]
MELNEQEIIRRQKLDELRSHGIEPYPAETWEVNTSSLSILAGFDADPEKFKELSYAGRIMSIRDM